MRRHFWILALVLIAVPAFAQQSDESGFRELNIGAQFSLGNLALRDLTVSNDPVEQLKAFFADVGSPLSKEQEQELNAIVEAQQKDMQAISESVRADAGPNDSTKKLNQDYLKRVNTVLTPAQQGAWRHYRIEQIKLRGGFPALKQILEQARVPLAAEQERSIERIFENFAARRAQLTQSNSPSTVEMDRLVAAEFNRVAALLTPEQRLTLQASRRAALSAKR